MSRAWLACGSVRPTLSPWPGTSPCSLQVVDEACIRCGQCLPACPHGAVKVNGEIGKALAIASQGDGILILSPESVAHFYPATPEQLINACYAAGFRAVTRGVIGDELVAAEYLKLWEEEPWGTLIRSTDPVVVETVRGQYPELVPYLAPVTMPAVAEARYLRAPVRHRAQDRLRRDLSAGGERRPGRRRSPSATWSRSSGSAGSAVLAQPTLLRAGARGAAAAPERGGRAAAGAAGGGAVLQPAVPQDPRARRAQGGRPGGGGGPAGPGLRGHPLDRGRAGPSALGAAGGAVLAAGAARRGRGAAEPVSGGGLGGGGERRRHVRHQAAAGPAPDPEAVAGILEQIGKGPNGRPWDCRACGFETCRRFAEAAALGRASMRQCTPYQERRAEEAQRAAAVDTMTGLSTYRVLRDRLAFEVERSKRSGEGFAVLFLDLDRFKEVNDQYGHEAGNEILARGGGRDPERGARVGRGGAVRRGRVRGDPHPDRPAGRGAGGRGAAGGDRGSRAAGWAIRRGSSR